MDIFSNILETQNMYSSKMSTFIVHGKTYCYLIYIKPSQFPVIFSVYNEWKIHCYLNYIHLPLQSCLARGRACRRYQRVETQSPGFSSWRRRERNAAGSRAVSSRPQRVEYPARPDPARQRRYGTGSPPPRMSKNIQNSNLKMNERPKLQRVSGRISTIYTRIYSG